MHTINLNCNNCGANLEVNKTTRFCQCNFCGTNLKVIHSDKVSFTELLHDVAENTVAIKSSTEALEIEAEIERLDREHDKRLKQLGTESSGNNGLWVIVSVIVAGVFFKFISNSFSKAPAEFRTIAYFIMSMVILGSIVAVYNFFQTSSSKKSYETKRKALLNQLSLIKTKGSTK